MVLETVLGFVVGAAFAWLFVYSAVLFGTKHALRDHLDAEVPSAADEPSERT